MHSKAKNVLYKSLASCFSILSLSSTVSCLISLASLFVFVRRVSHTTLLSSTMFFQYTSIAALAAVTFLIQAPTSLAGHVRHRHAPRMAMPNGPLARRATAGTVEIQSGQLQLLQSEITTFQGWMDTYINSTKSMDQATALAQLKQEFDSFNGWMNAFLADVLGTGPSTLPALPSTKALTAAPETSVVAAFSAALSTAPSSYSSLAAVLASSAQPAPTSTPAVAASPSQPASSAASVVAPEKLHSPSSQLATSYAIAPSISTSSSVPSPSAPATSEAASAPAPAPVSSASIVPSSAPGPSNPPSGSGGSFNAKSASNVAVYYGQSGATSQFTLAQTCQDPNVDIVVLAFVSDFFGPGGYPTLNLGSACTGSSPAMSAKGATGLISCPAMAQQITTCQGLGKKILVSLGGSIGTTAFSGTQQADQFATQLWNLFGGGTGESKDLRPFGDVKVDGFDVGKMLCILQ